MIQVIYDFAVKHVYYAQNPTTAERLAIVATGGYGRGELAPGSDIDLLFVRPFKQTAWGESVIEFILYMLWDLGLKVGHATRSLAECVRLAKQDITIRTALLEARYLWGDQALYDELRKKFWNEVATGNGQDFVEAKLAERDERHARQGESRYLVEPNIKEGKGGLRDLQTLYWIGKYLYHVEDAADLVEHGVFTARRIPHLPEGRSLSVECARASALSAGPRRRAAVLRRAAGAGGGAGLSRCGKTAPRGGSLHARLLPGGQGCRRSHPHLLRRAGRTAQEAPAVAHAACCRASSSRAQPATISMSRMGG